MGPRAHLLRTVAETYSTNEHALGVDGTEELAGGRRRTRLKWALPPLPSMVQNDATSQHWPSQAPLVTRKKKLRKGTLSKKLVQTSPPRKAASGYQARTVPQHPGAAGQVPTLRAFQEELSMALGEDSGQVPTRTKMTPNGHKHLCKNWGNESHSPCAIPEVTSCKSHRHKGTGSKARKQKQKD